MFRSLNRFSTIVPALGILGIVALLTVPSGGAPTADAGVGTDATISIGSCTISPGAQCTVDIVVTPEPGGDIGALDIRIDYDQTRVTAIGCTAPSGVCNQAVDVNTVSFAMVSLTGLEGTEGTITFSAVGAAGTFSDLVLEITSCAKTSGQVVSCTASHGKITITNTIDLSVSAAEIWPSPNLLVAGEPGATLNAFVHNSGSGPVSNVTVQFTDNANGPVATPLTIGSTTVTVEAGGTVVTVPWNTANQFGDNLITVSVDPGGQITETSETNNQASVSIDVSSPVGDVNCNGVTNAVDALMTLREASGLSYSHPPHCPLIP
jgi:hypothetical protein